MSKKYQFSLTEEQTEQYNKLYKLTLHAHAQKLASSKPEDLDETDFDLPTKGDLQNEIAEAGIIALLEKHTKRSRKK